MIDVPAADAPLWSPQLRPGSAAGQQKRPTAGLRCHARYRSHVVAVPPPPPPLEKSTVSAADTSDGAGWPADFGGHPWRCQPLLPDVAAAAATVAALDGRGALNGGPGPG